MWAVVAYLTLEVCKAPASYFAPLVGVRHTLPTPTSSWFTGLHGLLYSYINPHSTIMSSDDQYFLDLVRSRFWSRYAYKD